MLSPFDLGREGAHNVLYTLGHVAGNGESQRDGLQTVVLVLMEHRDMALFAVAWSHDAEVEAVGGQAEVVSEADGKLLEQGLLACDTGSYQRNVEAFQLFTILFSLFTSVCNRSCLLELTTLTTRVEVERDTRGLAWGNRFSLVVADGGTATGSIALLEGHRLCARIA